MFTIEEIKQAHSKVRSGADFPAYIQELKQLGVTHYTTYVADGHTDYSGEGDHGASSPVKCEALTIAEACDAVQFKADLKAHQQGESDYMTFCNQAAGAGIERWKVCMGTMTCTYFDKSGNMVLEERIPG